MKDYKLKLRNFYVYYESIKRELKIRSIYECRCDERLKTKTKEFTRLTYTGLVILFFPFLFQYVRGSYLESGSRSWTGVDVNGLRKRGADGIMHGRSVHRHCAYSLAILCTAAPRDRNFSDGCSEGGAMVTVARAHSATPPWAGRAQS